MKQYFKKTRTFVMIISASLELRLLCTELFAPLVRNLTTKRKIDLGWILEHSELPKGLD